MTTYFIRRLLLLVPTLVLVTVMSFALMRIVPGDVITAKVGSSGNPESLDVIRHELGLDAPAHIQYFRFMGSLLTGNAPQSLWSSKSVATAFVDAIPVTMELAILAILMSILIAVPVGILSAIMQDHPVDYIARVGVVLGISMPDFWIATVLIVVLSKYMGYLPPLEYVAINRDPVTNLSQFALPAAILGYRLSAVSARMIRSAMIEVIRQDYIRTARAKGLNGYVILTRHAMKNAFIPVITIWGNQVAVVLSGTVILESIFSLPGVGQTTFTAIQQRDYTQIQFNVLIMATIVVFVNMFVDVVYGWFDPRIRYA